MSYHNMTTQTFWESIAVIALVVVFLIFAIPALLQARAAVRDDLRRADIAQLKQALERYNNTAKNYVASPDGKLACTNSFDSNSWFFGSASPLRQQKVVEAIPHDVRESAEQNYRYCITQLDKHNVIGYFLEAQLEVPQADFIGFDEDEGRKYGYRILHEDSHILYRVCGGEEKQCGTGSAS